MSFFITFLSHTKSVPHNTNYSAVNSTNSGLDVCDKLYNPLKSSIQIQFAPTTMDASFCKNRCLLGVLRKMMQLFFFFFFPDMQVGVGKLQKRHVRTTFTWCQINTSCHERKSWTTRLIFYPLISSQNRRKDALLVNSNYVHYLNKVILKKN